MNRLTLIALALLLLLHNALLRADDAAGKVIDIPALVTAGNFKPSSPDATVTPGTNDEPGVLITFKPGKDAYPGIDFKPESGTWDWSSVGHVEATFINTGKKGVTIAIRVDNAGEWKDSPWNTEQTYVKPGATGKVKLIFGYAYDHKPSYKLNPAAVINLKIFCSKSDVETSFRLVSFEAAGPAGEKPAVDPNSVRIKPDGGVIYAAGAAVDPAKQFGAKGPAGKADADGIHVTFASGKNDQPFSFKPAAGRWDLRDALQVTVNVKNVGQAPITPRVRIDSNGGPSDWAVASSPLAAGAEQDLTMSFIAAESWNGDKTSGNKVTNDTVSAIIVATDAGEGERSLLIESITAGVPPTPALPDWLGQKPPIDGEWTKTFDDEFDGSAIDATHWNVTGDNYYDKASHWSKDNVLLGDGVAKLHYEKKTGRQNDDPKGKETPYATGFLSTYGKWTQRYGYFESRMKLSTAPGLWPAFWMMPDRGAAAGPQWKRSDTANGGMEFDIMEYLARWGPHRFNIAMHYDGYEKNHKFTGSDKIYFQPDKDGFITCGLLWTPGSLTYYCNGQVVLKWDNPRISTVPAFLMYTLPSGGWDNNGIDDKALPDDFVIDYVRCWQRKDLASATDGLQSAPATQPAQ